MFKQFGVPMICTFAVISAMFLGAKVDDVGTRVIAIGSLLLACVFVVLFLWRNKDVVEGASIESTRDVIDFLRKILFRKRG